MQMNLVRCYITCSFVGGFQTPGKNTNQFGRCLFRQRSKIVSDGWELRSVHNSASSRRSTGEATRRNEEMVMHSPSYLPNFTTQGSVPKWSGLEAGNRDASLSEEKVEEAFLLHIAFNFSLFKISQEHVTLKNARLTFFGKCVLTEIRVRDCYLAN